MENFVSNEKEEQTVKDDIFTTFEGIAGWLCNESVEPVYDVELLVMVGEGVPLESAETLCRHFVALSAGQVVNDRFDLFCAVVPYVLPAVKVQRKQYCGVPIRLSALLATALAWDEEDEYNPLMNYLCQLLTQITGSDDDTIFSTWLHRMIGAQRNNDETATPHKHKENHNPDCVCQQTHKAIIQAILKFLSGETFDLKWDVVIFFRHEGVNLNIPELLDTFRRYSKGDKMLELSMSGSGIPYGWSPEDNSGDVPVRVSELITYTCTCVDDDDRDILLNHIARLLSTVSRDIDAEYVYKQLLACCAALNHSRLH